MTDASIKVGIEGDDVVIRQMRRLEKGVERSGKRIARSGEVSFQRLTGSIISANAASAAFSSTLGLVTGAIGSVVDASTEFVKQGLASARTLESQEIGFKALLGSAEEAERVINRIKKEAKATPFELLGLSENTQALTAITKDGDKALDVLLDIGDAIALSGKGGAELNRVILNLQQIAATGQVTAIDLKQFRSAIPIFNDILSAAGLTSEELQNSESAAEDLFRAFDLAASEGGIAFEAMAQQAETANGRLSNLGDSIVILGADVVEQTGIFDLYKDAIGRAASFVEGAQGPFNDLIEEIKTSVSQSEFLKDVTDELGSAFDSFKTTILDKLQRAWEDFREEIFNNEEQIDGVKEAITDALSSFKGLLDVLKESDIDGKELADTVFGLVKFMFTLAKSIFNVVAGLAQMVKWARDSVNRIRDLNNVIKELIGRVGGAISSLGILGRTNVSPTVSANQINGPFLSGGGIVKPVYAQDGFFARRGTDTVPAMLTPGELVVPKALTGQLINVIKGISNVAGIQSPNLSFMSGEGLSDAKSSIFELFGFVKNQNNSIQAQIQDFNAQIDEFALKKQQLEEEEFEAERDLQQLRIDNIQDETQRRIEDLKFRAAEDFENFKGTEEQKAEFRKLLEENLQSEITEIFKAQEDTRTQTFIDAIKQRAQAAAQFAKEQMQIFERGETALQRIRIQAIADENERRLASLKFQAEQDIKGFVGTEDQKAEFKKLRERILQRELKVIRDRIEAQEEREAVANNEVIRSSRGVSTTIDRSTDNRGQFQFNINLEGQTQMSIQQQIEMGVAAALGRIKASTF